MRDLCLVAMALASAVLTSWPQRDWIVINQSSSVPVGAYWRVERPPVRGDFVTLRVPETARAYAAGRGFSDIGDRFLKRVAASQGQHVCAEGNSVTIDGTQHYWRQRADTMGVSLPYWEGCLTLAADQMLLMGDTADSFDGRYWGITHTRAIEAVWVRLGEAN